MNELAAPICLPGVLGSPLGDPLRDALLDSRQRWRDLVALAADLAFETDAFGRFTFVFPDQVLGWPAATLIGQPASLLLDGGGADGGSGGAARNAAATLDPFSPAAPVRGRRAWLRRADGGAACMVFAAAPLLDGEGRIIGSRGLAQDTTRQEHADAVAASALRRNEVLDHILTQMRQEVLAPRMMQAVLDSIRQALGAEGAAVLDLLRAAASQAVLHQSGSGADQAAAAAFSILQVDASEPAVTATPEGRPLLACHSYTRFGERAGLALWRGPNERPWDAEDRQLVGSVAGLMRMVLEHESIQREMARQARTDPLTGLLNRRAFLEECARRIDRLDREGLPGTLLFIDLDNFKPLNDRAGHDVGDEALSQCASMLRAVVRPADLVARLGGDEFAIWMDGSDELTAAERAETLRLEVPRELRHLMPGDDLQLSMSIGIACRRVGGAEDLDSLMRRADLAMYEVKRAGRGHWRVSHEEAAP